MSKTTSGSSSDLSSNSSWTLLEEPPDSSVTSSKSRTDAKQNDKNEVLDGSVTDLLQNGDKKEKKKDKNITEEPINLVYTIFLLAVTVAMFLIVLKLPTSENLNNIKPFGKRNLTTVIDNDLLSTVMDEINENFADEGVCDAKEFSNLSLTSFDNFDEDLLAKDYKAEDESKKEQQPRFQTVKKLLRNRKFQMFVATLIQDLCLIKLVNELTKATEGNPAADKKGTGKKAKKNSKAGTRKDLQASSKALKNIKPLLSEGDVIEKIARIYANKSSTEVDETGQSECEKRFTELDVKWNALGKNHRQKVQLIREKFQKKITEIKEKEKETFDRRQKISYMREKFIQRLKVDREVYLFNLTKLREERQKLLDEVCQRYRHCRDFSPKDASVGNRALLEPTDFQNNLQKLREREAVESGLPNGAPYDDERLEIVMPARVNHKKKNLSQVQETYSILRRKYIRKKAKLLHKRRAHAERDEVIKTVSNIVDNVVHDNNEEQGTRDQTVLKRGSKRNLNLIYDVAFEGQSKRIKQIDFFKWRGNRDNRRVAENGQNLMSKQDPQKMYSAKILHNKGVL